MDEDFLTWLLLIPGIGRKRAERLAETFQSAAALRAASVAEVAAVEGFGEVLAQRVKDHVAKAEGPDDFWYKTEPGLYLCPECGSLIARDAAKCPSCGTVFEGEEPGVPEPESEVPTGAAPTDALQPEGQELNLCPQCGAFVGKGVTVCPFCGTHLEGEVEPEVEGVVEPAVDRLQPENQGLYLCPNCGSMVAADASVCPKCGASLEGEEQAPAAEAEEVAELPPEAISGQPSLFVCTNCGAFLRAEDTKCPSCGVEFEEGEVAEATLADKEEELGFFPICPNCGALVPSTAKKCAICGHRMGEPVAAKPAEVAPEEAGITRDFLERWRRVSGEKALTPEQKLLQEMEQYDSILASDPSVERAWIKKIGILLRLGRVREAVESYEKLADLNPAKDDDYRLQVLSILRAQGDMSMMPRRWSEIAATEPAKELVTPPKVVEEPAVRESEELFAPVIPEDRADATKIAQALDFYDRLLQLDPSLLVGWQTKAELLEKLGRSEEAAEALRHAEALAKGTPGGLRTRAPGGAPRVTGRVNGIGRTNGRVNGTGRINGTGRVNGTGRINGTGRVNGMMSPGGRTNGMMSGVPGGGFVNGLVNGNGFTNGRRGRFASPPPSTRAWARSVAGVAGIVLLLLMMPILGTLLSTSPTPGGIQIDGRFGDWGKFPTYTDGLRDQVANPDVNLVAYKLQAIDGNLFAWAQVNGTLFEARSGGTDATFVFIDEDGSRGTGFRIGGLGADRAVEVYGWNRTVQGTTVWVYNATRGGAVSDDWRSFDPSSGATAASGFNELEVKIPVGPRYDEARSRVLFHTLDGIGDGDAADAVVGSAGHALAVTQDTIAGDIVASGEVPFLHVVVQPQPPNQPINITSLTVQKLGSIPSANVEANLYVDQNGNGLLDLGDTRVGTQPFTPAATFVLNRQITSAASFIVTANLTTPPANASVGLLVSSVQPEAVASVPVTLTDMNVNMSYVGGAPMNVTIDGAFADWYRYARRLDPANDVRSWQQNGSVNANIDLREFEAVVGQNVSIYMHVDGRMLGGVDIPNMRARPGAPTAAVDSDGDGVPDSVETAISPGLALDFNNDNISDAEQWTDVDQDGTKDYNKCTTPPDCAAFSDLWLETTIPAWYPPQYAGTPVKRYIGPVSLPAEKGVDTALVYVDRDNRTDTGLLTTVDAIPYGFDYAYQAVGRAGLVINASLYVYNASRSPIPWQWVQAVPTAVDVTQLEASLDGRTLNLTATYSLIFFTTDWQFNYDSADLGTAIRRAPGGSSRSPSGNAVVINEVSPSPNPEWIELANPTASWTNLNGWTLQRKQGNNWATIYTFTQSIGPWGSGAEYLAVDLSGNSLPNGQTTIRLVAVNGTEIDRTTYSSAVGNGQTWSRFKSATTGKPVDSDNDANDFYIDTTPTRGAPNTRHRPNIRVAKIANKATAAPGDTIVYTVYYNNTDTGRANTVWINDTLPANVAYQSSSVGYSSTNGRTYRWIFTNVNGLSPYFFTITVKVNNTAPDGVVQRNTVGLNYTDQLNRKQTGSVATANTTTYRPMITVAKIVNKKTALPGDTLMYTVFYNNTGSQIANHVWINDTLPVGVTYQNANPVPNQISGQLLKWHFTNVAVGAHSLSINVTVNASPPGVLVNWAILNYTAQNNVMLPGSSASAITSVPEFHEMIVPIAFPIVLYAFRRFRKKEG
ncbi:MAG: DUF11 domain-containing protein [Methanobacteriota archaeon]|nr:MAG: DUF11 domain-containing protein [Euryarchaeota archaeon]